MKRLFIAIPLNLNNLAKQSILEIQTQLSQNSIKWVSFDNLHLTLQFIGCLLYTSPSPRDRTRTRMPSSA